MAYIDKKNVLTILEQRIKPGESARINFNTAKLFTTSPVEVPIIIERSKNPGPIILLTAGIHGDEINGIEVIRQIIAKKINKPKKGTVICIPVVNITTHYDKVIKTPLSLSHPTHVVHVPPPFHTILPSSDQTPEIVFIQN